jgi:hypothetical protein
VKRRLDEFDVVAPAALLDYRAWCADRDVPPFGVPDDLESMADAVVRWKVWERERAQWAAARGVDETDLPTSGCGAPFDWSLI